MFKFSYSVILVYFVLLVLIFQVLSLLKTAENSACFYRIIKGVLEYMLRKIQIDGTLKILFRCIIIHGFKKIKNNFNFAIFVEIF